MSYFVNVTYIYLLNRLTCSLFIKRFNLSSSLLSINVGITIEIWWWKAVLSVEYALQWKIKWYSFSIWLLLQALHSLFSSFTPYHLYNYIIQISVRLLYLNHAYPIMYCLKVIKVITLITILQNVCLVTITAVSQDH